MTCLLCMEDATTPAQRFIDIFSEEGCQMTVCSIIAKHLWLKPERDICTGQRICWTCWEALRDFHKFYQRIAAIHNHADWKTPFVHIEHEDDPLPQEIHIKSEVTDDAEEKLQNSINVGENMFESEAILEVAYTPTDLLPQVEIIEGSKPISEKVQSAKRRGRPPKDANAKLSATTKGVKKLPTQRKHKDHIKNKHDPESTIICDKCGKQVPAQDMKEHNKLEHSKVPRPIPPKPRQCQLCGTWLRHMSALKQHMKTIHAGPCGEHPCQNCKQVLTSARALKRHVYLNHESEGKFKCTMCEKTFKRPKELKEHTTTHTGEVLYTCTDTASATRDFIAPRINASDSTISAECDNANPSTMYEKAFQHPQYLKEHTSTHTGEVFYTCPETIGATRDFFAQKIEACDSTLSTEGGSAKSDSVPQLLEMTFL
ncbi:zinc finger protein 91 [Zeugodacus cucurbitae]|nr:zinc finger protein 91 [Zeugodacus cucurbitae]